MKAALCQIDTVLGAIEKNLVKINHYTDKAIDKKCDLAIFPELALTGYNLRDLVGDVSIGIDNHIFNDLIKKSMDIDIVLGYAENDSGYFYNSAVYLSKGEIIYNYRKNFLPDYGMFEEGRYFTNGSGIDTINTNFGKITVFICEDAFHISAQNAAFRNNTEILLILSASPFWMDSESIKPDLWKSVCSNFSQLAGSHVIFTDRVGFEDGVGFFGGSFVMNPNGQIIKKAGLFKEELLIAEFNEKLSQKAKMTMPILKNEDTEYAYR